MAYKESVQGNLPEEAFVRALWEERRRHHAWWGPAGLLACLFLVVAIPFNNSWPRWLLGTWVGFAVLMFITWLTVGIAHEVKLQRAAFRYRRGKE